jgi:hypothetical protein
VRIAPERLQEVATLSVREAVRALGPVALHGSASIQGATGMTRLSYWFGGVGGIGGVGGVGAVGGWLALGML